MTPAVTPVGNDPSPDPAHVTQPVLPPVAVRVELKVVPVESSIEDLPPMPALSTPEYDAEYPKPFPPPVHAKLAVFAPVAGFAR
jgi:hypothetical protein